MRLYETHNYNVAAVPKPKDDAQETEGEDTPLPQTLVRIPTHQVGLLPQGAPGGGAD
jgi:hypothetical protein